MMTRRNALALVVLCLPALGCSSTTNQTSCGAGTTPQDGVCVVADSGQPEAQTNEDSSAPEGSADATAASDATQEAATDSGVTRDASTSDASDAAQYDADPCPVNSFTQQYGINCDPNCVAEEVFSQANCQSATCTGGGSWQPGSPGDCPQLIFARLPSVSAPDPQCALDCPSSSWVYGLAMSFAPNLGNAAYSMTVSPPWYLITGTSTPSVRRPMPVQPVASGLTAPRAKLSMPSPMTPTLLARTSLSSVLRKTRVHSVLNVVRRLYHFGRSVSDLAQACRLMGEGAYDRLHAQSVETGNPHPALKESRSDLGSGRQLGGSESSPSGGAQ